MSGGHSLQRILEQVEHMPRQKELDVVVETGELDIEETCEGMQYSPRIAIGNLRSPFLAVVMEDADHPTGNFPHWLLWNVERMDIIPRNIPKREEFTKPIRGVQGRNGFGRRLRRPRPPRAQALSLRVRRERGAGPEAGRHRGRPEKALADTSSSMVKPSLHTNTHPGRTFPGRRHEVSKWRT